MENFTPKVTVSQTMRVREREREREREIIVFSSNYSDLSGQGLIKLRKSKLFQIIQLYFTIIIIIMVYKLTVIITQSKLK